MKKIIATIMTALLLMATGCSDSKRIDGVMYKTYGVFNKEEARDPSIHYEVVISNIFWGNYSCRDDCRSDLFLRI